MATNFSDRLRANPDYLAYQQAIPQNTNADGNRGSLELGNVQGRLEICIEIQEDIDLTDANVLTILLEGSATETGTYATVDTYTLTAAAGSGVITAGTVIHKYIWVPEEDPMWCNVNIATDDADVDGAFDVYVRLIA